MLQTSAKRKYPNTCQTSVGQVYQTVRKGIEGSGLLLSWHGSWGAGGSRDGRKVIKETEHDKIPACGRSRYSSRYTE